MARIIVMKDKSPLIISKDEMTTPAVAVCRCGLSGGWPMCDGSHMETHHEPTEEILQYRREANRLVSSRFKGDPHLADPRPTVQNASRVTPEAVEKSVEEVQYGGAHLPRRSARKAHDEKGEDDSPKQEKTA
jgi:CDGSH-type Zn-finger protein